MGNRNSGYERIPNDKYETPAWVTRSLLDTYPIHRDVWEPACGNGKMVRALEGEDHIVWASDKVDYNWSHNLLDFTDGRVFDAPFGGAFAIVTNPPYGSLAEKFILRALDCTRDSRGQVAMLLPTDYDHAPSRRALFAQGAFAAKIMLPHRIKWIEGSKGSPTHNHCWFVWSWTHGGPAHALYAQPIPKEDRHD